LFVKPRASYYDVLVWTRRELIGLTAYATLVTGAHAILGLSFLQLPWAPIGIVGTAVAFIVGFQNNAAYDRIWEARKIWGGVVNTSRTWGMHVLDMVTTEHAKNETSDEELRQHHEMLIHRHIAWLTALRHAMRQPRPWEDYHSEHTNREWAREVHIPERIISLEDDLFACLPDDDWEVVDRHSNKAAAILTMQSKHLRELKEKGLLWEFAFLQLESVLEEMFTLQGKSERIKNFPYPRQYATLSYQFVRLFLAALPFAIVPEFVKIGTEISTVWPVIGSAFVWVSIPLITLVAWLFHTMERTGRVGENPFAGSTTDVPISTISRGIEIDLRQMLGEDPENIPRPVAALMDVQM